VSLLESLYLHYLTTDAPHARTIRDCELELNLVPGSYVNRSHYPLLALKWAKEDHAVFTDGTSGKEPA
jgi:hypothetical protein